MAHIFEQSKIETIAEEISNVIWHNKDMGEELEETILI